MWIHLDMHSGLVSKMNTVRVIILIISILPYLCATEDVSEVCLFGQAAHCPFHCHCDARFSSTCDPLTGICPGNKCAQFAGDSASGGTYTPWFQPGCQLGNVGLEKEFSVQLSGLTVQTHRIESPYGGTVPLLCLFQDEKVELDKLEFVLDFKSRIHLDLLQIRSRYDTKVLFNAYHSGLCSLDGFITDDPDSKTNDTHCSSRYPSYDESVMFVCSKKGRYFILTSSGCNLGDLNLTNICIEAVEAFGYPSVDIECSRCMENNNSVLKTNVQTYLGEMNKILENSIEANNTMDLLKSENDNCGNGIWCEACELGWMPPDCQKQCPYGTFGLNCASHCIRQEIPDQYHCKDQTTHACDPKSGAFIQCSEGCDLWYAGGNLCTDYVDKFQYEASFSNVTVGASFVSFSFSAEDRIPRNLSEYYIYHIDYALDHHQEYLLYPVVILHDSHQVSYFANITNLPLSSAVRIRVRLGRKQGGIMEIFPVNSTKLYTTSCIGKPDVKVENLSLYVRWNSSIMHPQCGSIHITGIYVRDEGKNSFYTYNIEDATEIRVPDLDEGLYTLHLAGYSGNGYKVTSSSVLVEIKEDAIEELTPTGSQEGEPDDTQTNWKLNQLGMILLVILVIVLVITIMVVIVTCVICQRKTNSDEKSDNRPLSNINHSGDGVRRYVRDPSIKTTNDSTLFDNNFEMEKEFQSGKRQRKDTDHALHQRNRASSGLNQDVESYYHQISETDKINLGVDNCGYVQAVSDSFKSANNGDIAGAHIRTPSVDAPRPDLLGSSNKAVDTKALMADRPAPKLPERGNDEEVLYYGRNASNKSDAGMPVFL